jgi:hypothetical protein
MSYENIENIIISSEGKMNENALMAAEAIGRYLDGWGVLFPFGYEDIDGGLVEITYEGAVLIFESIIAHHYSEEPRDGSIPFVGE